ncbi:MAG: SUMF1/EgtB/PvdO family nonheme iron enzyme, partial [Planctomycetota bacterium]
MRAALTAVLLLVDHEILPGFVQVAAAPAEEPGGMVLVAARRVTVGTGEAERKEIAGRFDCHPTWLGDDLPQREVPLSAFWIDRHTVTNSQYLAFVEATG